MLIPVYYKQFIISKTDSYRLIDLFDIHVVGRCFPVTRHNPFDTKCLEIRKVAKITTIGYFGFTIWKNLENTFISPFPDKPTQQLVMTVNLIPVFLQVPDGISH